MVKSNHREWSSMPPEILELISDCLPLVDFFNFRRVCSWWRWAPSASRTNVTKFSKDKPWLLFYDVHNGDDRCYFYSTSYCCTFRLPDLKGATIVESKFGWFLAHRFGDFFFYNPFSFQKIDVGKHYIAKDQAYTFTTNPTSPRCIVYIVSGKDDNKAVELASRRIHEKEKEWTVKSFNVTRKIERMLGMYSCGCEEEYWIWIFDSVSRDSENKDVKNGVCYWEDIHKGVTVNGLVGEIKSEDLDMDLLRAEDWVRKFGAGGISVSSINVCCCDDLVVRGRFAETVEVVMDGDEASRSHELKIVKAAWIQPRLA